MGRVVHRICGDAEVFEEERRRGTRAVAVHADKDPAGAEDDDLDADLYSDDAMRCTTAYKTLVTKKYVKLKEKREILALFKEIPPASLYDRDLGFDNCREVNTTNLANTTASELPLFGETGHLRSNQCLVIKRCLQTPGDNNGRRLRRRHPDGKHGRAIRSKHNVCVKKALLLALCDVGIASWSSQTWMRARHSRSALANHLSRTWDAIRNAPRCSAVVACCRCVTSDIAVA